MEVGGETGRAFSLPSSRATLLQVHCSWKVQLRTVLPAAQNYCILLVRQPKYFFMQFSYNRISLIIIVSNLRIARLFQIDSSKKSHTGARKDPRLDYDL